MKTKSKPLGDKRGWEGSYFEIIDTPENHIKFETWLKWIDKCWTKDVEENVAKTKKDMVEEIEKVILPNKNQTLTLMNKKYWIKLKKQLLK